MDYVERIDRVCKNVIEPNSIRVDKEGVFPHEAIAALKQEGLLGLISAKPVGGQGQDLHAAAQVILRIAQDCPSTAMVLCMHYCATAVLEAQGSDAVRTAIANGEHLSTLAFSEAGSRSHFWAPVSTAERIGDTIHLNAHKSWVTSAFEADSYVWSSQSLSQTGSTLWLVASDLAGLSQPGKFDGLGLRGNASTPIVAQNVTIPADCQLGQDGKGFDTMMGVVLPWFSVLSAACCVGLCHGILERAIGHVAATKHIHLSTSLADLPTIRAYLARAKIQTDAAATLLQDTIFAIQTERADSMLRVLEVKAAASETALNVSETAMRVCGGAAFRKEAGIERLFRDARASYVMAPTSDVLYDFIGKAITGLPLF